MPLQPWIGKEPIRVSSDAQPLNYYIERETQSLAINTLRTFTPPIDEYWKVHALQIDISASAVAGTRRIWLYTKDTKNRQMRYEVLCATAGNTYTMILQPQTPLSSNNAAGIPYDRFTYTGPLWFDFLVQPVELSVFWDNFGDAGDVASVSLLVSKYKRS